MEELTITWDTILAFFGAVAIIGGGLKVLAQLLNPFKELKARLGKHDQLLDNDNKRLKAQEEMQAEIRAEMKLQGMALMEIMNHMISGNDVEKLKKRYQEMVEHYVEK